MEAALAEVADANPAFMTLDERAEAMRRLAAVQARADELGLRLMSASVDVAETEVQRDVAAWQVAHNRRDIRTAKADLRLARALDDRFTQLRDAMADGRVHLDQAHVIAAALDRLPSDLGADVMAAAERMLVDLASQHTPRELGRLGRRILDTAAPDVAEQTLARQLETEEAEARRKTRLSLRPNGDGTTRITAVVPDASALRLQTFLDALTSPRQGANRGHGPYPKILGQAFCTLLERVDPDALPRHGGRATTVVVTVSLESLRKELGAGDLIGGDALSATEVRRLACSAGIVPLVLGGKGEILDLGRQQRLFTAAQHQALVIWDQTCRGEGCDVPGTWSEAHHWVPWSRGGATDLDDGVLLCSFHHHRVHDPRFTADRLPNGGVRFTRRR
ncbi:HNH endonuclease signature motif containing protein [Nocardioides sp. CER19]|uniref:HNH endonuclease signature motif containing protein n=1 Tax=Nocardioides sp. CER19 TaxID=3038538 RepID=UPI00244A4228|nr:HNH endonuclease signature motif containing protein [Nocardioides sp. CER19]MDH2413262.1 DUF222 domain-containing protein [Nocardioides sp. CER19]